MRESEARGIPIPEEVTPVVTAIEAIRPEVPAISPEVASIASQVVPEGGNLGGVRGGVVEVLAQLRAIAAHVACVAEEVPAVAADVARVRPQVMPVAPQVRAIAAKGLRVSEGRGQQEAPQDEDGAGERAACRAEMARAARAELDNAKRLLPLVRADSRIGYESSNQYFYVPQDVLEKVLCCRSILAELEAANANP